MLPKDSPKAITILKKAWYCRVAEPVGVAEPAGVAESVTVLDGRSVETEESEKNVTSGGSRGAPPPPLFWV